MGNQIITMWELYGCGMEGIASAVAEQLDVPLHGQAFTSEQVEEAAASREKGGLFTRFLASLSPAMLPGSSAEDAVIGAVQAVEDAARQVRETVHGCAAEGGVILGRNGQFLLHGHPQSLHVKLIGQREGRIARGAQLAGISLEHSAKRQPVEDAFRRELAMRIFKFDPATDDYYDLVIDTTRFTPDDCVALIVAAAKARAAFAD